MKKVKIYLDNCCFNRPFDDQTSLVIQLETESKLDVQDRIRQGLLSLCWSFVLDYENAANPFEEVRNRISAWKQLALFDCNLCDEIANKANSLVNQGLKQMDAAHIACAIYMGAEYFLTTDKKILNKQITDIIVINPIDFIRSDSDAE